MREKGLKELILFDNIANDPIARLASELFECYISDNHSKDADGAGGKASADYFELQRQLLSRLSNVPVGMSPWQGHLCSLVGAADNVFSRMAEQGYFDRGQGASHPIFELASDEIKAIKALFELDFGALARAVEAESGVRIGNANIAGLELGMSAGVAKAESGVRAGNADIADTSIELTERARKHTSGIPESQSNATGQSGNPIEPIAAVRRSGILQAFALPDASNSARRLAAYYRTFGAGALEACDAFVWEGHFRGVAHHDPITMEGLIGYDRQKSALIENTEFLLRGLPASNVLLYGDSGTGKSSLVKALLNRYRSQGLKLVAVPKARIGDMGEILAHIAERGLKFIVFIDDLSFEENDGSYKAFKSIIEGSVNGRPRNAVICVTSNRRNIVKEVWKDREGLDADDVHLRDNLQEKRSLADRFGLTLVFSAPDKPSYLGIVSALADQAGLDVDQETLCSGALAWGIRHGGRSGRTARQYIDHLLGVQTLMKSEIRQCPGCNPRRDECLPEIQTLMKIKSNKCQDIDPDGIK